MPIRQPVTIVKASGERVPFDVRKVESACRRAGASVRIAQAIARSVASRVRNGMTTQQLGVMVRHSLHREHPVAAVRFSLKEAMRRLGPAGYDFEKFIAEVLRMDGYTAELPDLLPGMCVQHEVDVIASKDGRTAMIECKYRNEPGIYVRLKDVMATWARFDDLREAHAAGKCPVGFSEAWIVTNTKITSDGLAFGGCKGMRFLGWRYPADNGLERRIEEQRSYPVTILRSVNARIWERLAAVGLLLVRDLAERDPVALAAQLQLPRAAAERLHDEAAALIA